MKRVRKAVIPVAGMGTRFLPATKAVPKELLPLVDTPAIHMVVNELIKSGVEVIIFITARGKTAITDYFDHSYELEDILKRRGKSSVHQEIRSISQLIRTISIRQKEPLGLGHAVLCAKEVIGDEYFYVILPDDIIINKPPATQQLLEVHQKTGKGVIAVMDVPRSDTQKYGIVDGFKTPDNIFQISGLVEKPEPEFAPSTSAIVGRYLLPPVIFEYLQNTEPGHGGEIQLTDALQKLSAEQGLVAHYFEGVRYDIGEKFGFLQANIELALKNPVLGPQLKEYIKDLAQKLN